MRSISEIIASETVSSTEMAYHNLSKETLSVVVFHDACTDKRWFMRNHSEVGTLIAVCEGGRPIRPQEVLAVARQHFGAEAHVLWL